MLFRNIRLIFSTNALILLCGVVTSLLTAWALRTEGRGELAVILAWPSVCVILADLGIGQASQYVTARRPETVSAIFSNGLLFTLAGGLLALGLAQLIVPYLVGERTPEVMWLLRAYLCVIPLGLCAGLLCNLLAGAQLFAWVGAARLSQFIVQASVYFILWLSHRLTVATATYTVIAAHAVMLLIAFVGVRRKLHPRWQPSWTEWETVYRYGLRDYLGALSGSLALRMDQLLLAGFASSTVIGLYFIAARLAEITVMLALPVADAVLPVVAAAKSEKQAVQVLMKCLRLTLGGYLLLLIPAWFAAPALLRVVYGAEFVAATDALRVLLLASVVWSAGNILTNGLKGLGQPGTSTKARFAAALITALTFPVGLTYWGVTGVALAALAGYATLPVVALLGVARHGQLSLRECLRPRLSDLPLHHLKMRLKVLAFGGDLP